MLNWWPPNRLAPPCLKDWLSPFAVEAVEEGGFPGSRRRLPRKSHAPGRQSSFSPSRIILDPVNRLPGEPCGPSDLANACGLPKHRLRAFELLAAVARLATLVGERVAVRLRVSNACSLRFLRSLRLRLRRCRHEGDERVSNCALHGVLGRAVECDAVDHGTDDDAPLHELADGLADVFVVTSKAVNPPNNEGIAAAEQVEQSAPLRPFAELRAHAGDATVRDDLVELEARLLG